MKLNRMSFIILLPLIIILPVRSQDNGNQQATTLLNTYFDNLYGADERLITGPFYYGPTRGSIVGDPYYTDDTWKGGSIQTTEALFTDLKLKYDIYLNQIILMYTSTDNAVYQVGLRTGNIIRATIGDKEFIPLPGITDSINAPFAELVSDGPLQYLVTRSKYIQISNGSGSSDYEYKEILKQYLFYEGSLLPFTSKRTLYRKFPGLKSDLKKFSRKNNLFLAKKNIEVRGKLMNYCNILLSDSNE